MIIWKLTGDTKHQAFVDKFFVEENVDNGYENA